MADAVVGGRETAAKYRGQAVIDAKVHGRRPMSSAISRRVSTRYMIHNAWAVAPSLGVGGRGKGHQFGPGEGHSTAQNATFQSPC